MADYNQRVRLLFSEPFGWLAPPKSTRPREPTLFMDSSQNPSLLRHDFVSYSYLNLPGKSPVETLQCRAYDLARGDRPC